MTGGVWVASPGRDTDRPRGQMPDPARSGLPGSLQLVDATDRAAHVDARQLRVLLALDDPSYEPALVPASFFLRLLALDGSEPVVDVCVNCGKSAPLVAFDAQIGGTLCDNCRQGAALSPAALTLLRRVVGGDLAGVLREVNPPGAGEVMALAQEAIETHFGRRLRAPGASAPLSVPPSGDA